MRLCDLKNGQTVTRKPWASRNLTIRKANALFYYANSNNPISINSSAWDHDDYILVHKEPTMAQTAKYTDATIAVQEGDSTVTTHNNEVDAIEHIQNRLEASPKARFKMFKSYQVVEPQRVDITSMIKSLP